MDPKTCKNKGMNNDDIFKFMTDPDAQQNGDQWEIECYPTSHVLSGYPTMHEIDTGETE